MRALAAVAALAWFSGAAVAGSADPRPSAGSYCPDARPLEDVPPARERECCVDAVMESWRGCGKTARRDATWRKMLVVCVVGLRVQLLSSCGEPLFEGRAERSRAAAPGGE